MGLNSLLFKVRGRDVTNGVNGAPTYRRWFDVLVGLVLVMLLGMSGWTMKATVTTMERLSRIEAVHPGGTHQWPLDAVTRKLDRMELKLDRLEVLILDAKHKGP